MKITVTAKVSGYHPATGLRLVEGEPCEIDEEAMSDEVFVRLGPGTGDQGPGVDLGYVPGKQEEKAKK